MNPRSKQWCSQEDSKSLSLLMNESTYQRMPRAFCNALVKDVNKIIYCQELPRNQNVSFRKETFSNRPVITVFEKFRPPYESAHQRMPRAFCNALVGSARAAHAKSLRPVCRLNVIASFVLVNQNTICETFFFNFSHIASQC